MADFVSPASFSAQSPTPQPSPGIASGQPPQLDNSGANAHLAAAKMFQDIGDATKQYAEQLDTVSAQNAVNQLRQKQDELSFGPQGFLNVKGGAVVDPNRQGGPLMDDYKSRFQAATDDITKNLSPGAMRMFMPHASVLEGRFLGQLGRHSVAETEKWQEGVYKDGQLQVQTDAARYAGDPAQLGQIAQRAATQAQTLAHFKGIPGDGAAKSAASGVYRIGVETLLGTGANRQALSYFDSIKGQLDGADLVALQTKLKTVQSDINGENAANEELARLGLPPMPSSDPSAGGFADKQQFIKAMMPHALEVSKATGLDPRLVLAQSALETAYGRAAPGNNFFGIKSGGKPGGQVLSTTEVGANGPYQTRDSFRTYADAGASARDYADFLKSNSRYAPVLAAKGLDAQIDAMGKSGYATDPNYAAKLRQIAQSLPDPSGERQQGPFGGTLINARGGTPGMPDSGGGLPQFKGDIKAAYAQAENALIQRTDLNYFDKAKGVTLLAKLREQLTAFQTASTKSLDDEAGSTMASILAQPGLLKPGTFQGFADRYQALGDGEKAMRFRLLASMEGSFKDGLQSSTDAQLEMLKQLAPEGLPKQVIEGYIAGSTKERAAASVQGTEGFGQLHKSIETDNVHPSALTQQAKDTITSFVHAGKPEEARKVSDYMLSALEAERMTGQNSAAAEQAIADLKAHADSGLADAHQLQVLSMARGMFDRQQQMISQDPYKAGTSIFPEVGPAPQLDLTSPENAWQTMDIRSNQARKIAALTGKDTIPFTNEEVEAFRLGLDKGNPDQNAAAVSTLAKAIPADMIPGVSKALVGKAGGDGISQSYGAAFGLYASGDAADGAVANEILRGATMRKARGEEAKAATPAQQQWRAKIQDEIGTSLSRADPRQRAMVEQAIESVYTYRMARAGKSADGYDDGVLRDATRAVLGNPVTVNGGQMYPPQRGMTSYDVDAALRTITDADVKGLKTLDGTDIPARLIQGAQLENVGSGQYVVTVRDPRTGTRAEIPDPRNPRSAWVLDLHQYVDRARANPTTVPEFSQGIALP